jgi:accessory gene regulator protein AgrB
MYAWIWRHLPGPLAVRITIAAVLVLGVVALLMFVLFPWIEPHLPFNNVTTTQ